MPRLFPSGSYFRLLIMAVVICIWFIPGQALAVDPEEVLSDPVLEERARGLSAKLRCLVCQNQSIDDSDAALAKDLRVLLRQRLVAGDTDRQVIDYIVSRYGEFVLLQPRFGIHTLLLWSLPVILVLIGLVFLFFKQRGQKDKKTNELSDEEKARLTALLGKGD